MKLLLKKPLIKLPPIVAHGLTMSGAALVSQAIGFIRGIIMGRLLGPGGFGYLNGLLLIPTYSELSHLGVLNAMKRNAPIAIGKKDVEEAEKILSNTFGFVLMMAVLVATGVSCFALLWKGAPGFKLMLICMGVYVIIQQTGNYVLTLSVVRMRFHVNGTVSVLSVSLELLFAFTLGYFWKLPGVVLGIVSGRGVAVIVGLLLMKPISRPTINWAIIRKLLTLGFSLLWITSTTTILMSIDRLIILKMLGSKELGFYAIGIMSVSLLLLVPGAVGQIISPRLMRAYGANEPGQVKKLLKEPIVMLCLIVPLIAGTGALLLPVTVHLLLPKFINGILPAQILLLCYTPFAARSFSNEVLVASNNIKILGWFQIAGIVIAVCIFTGSIHFGYGIVGVAFGAAAVYWFLGFTVMGYALKLNGGTLRSSFIFMAKAAAPMLLVITLVAGLFRAVRILNYHMEDPAVAAAGVAVFLALAFPLFLKALARYTLNFKTQQK